MSQTKAQLIDAVDGSIVTADIADQAITLDKLLHGTGSTNGKFLRANNGADPTFESVITDLVNDTSPQLGGDLASNGNDILIAANDRVVFGTDKLRVKHTDSNADIENTTGNIVIKNDSSSTSEQIILQAKGGEDSIKAIADGAVELYHNNVKKFETTSGGISVAGDVVGEALSATNANAINLADSKKINLGNSSDLQLYYDGSDGYVQCTTTGLRIESDQTLLRSADSSETYISTVKNGSVELYYDNTKRFETTANGAEVFGNNSTIFKASCATNSTAEVLFQNSENNTLGDLRLLLKVGTNQGSDPYIKFDAGGNDMIVGTLYAGGANNKLVLGHGGSPSGGVIGLHIDGNGQITPDSNNARDLGNNSLRFRNIYTNDLNLSNEGSANNVDGTWGNYTIQEGFEDLFLINKRNGKKYKFNLTEVS